MEDAELLLDQGRYASSNALAILALEEAGKYTAILSNQKPSSKKAKLHIYHQEVIGQYFESAAMFEAFAREADGLLEYLKTNHADGYAEASQLPRDELIRFTIASIASDPSFDLKKFVRKIVAEDPSLRFSERSGKGEYHRLRQRSIHADYDELGNLISDPSAITAEEARESVELARFAANLQRFWVEDLRRHSQQAPSSDDGET